MEVPDYLNDIKIDKFRAPATALENELPFGLLEPRIFERFCCDLVYKRVELNLGSDVVDVLPIGVSGQKQYGADIFVKDNSNTQGGITLYEVKRVKSYTLGEYRKTLDRFLNNYDHWGVEISEFNLFVAEDISAQDIALWQSEAGKISNRPISFRVIPAYTLNKWVRDFPELVYKYFHPAWTEILFGKSAIWHLENYGVWGYEEPAIWNGYTGPSKNLYGDSLTYINDHVRIHAHLPSLEKNSASCYIEFRNGRFSHVMITLSHKQLVQNYFIGADIPISDADRPFLLKSVDDESYFCDIGNCRIKLSLPETLSLSDALDVCWDEYKRRVIEIEDTWRSKHFNYHTQSTEDIPLLRIKRGLWSLLLDFAEHHDAFNSTGDWSLFDSCPGWLKIYTNRESKEMDVGYHAFIKPKKHEGIIANYRAVDDEVVLVWQPPNDFFISNKGTIVNPRNYWDAETTHNWLIAQLIPKALEWRRNKSHSDNSGLLTGITQRLLKNKNANATSYNPDDYVISFFEPYPNPDLKAIEDIDDLLFVITRLQSFFNTNPSSIYINPECDKNLYKSLSEVLSKTEIDDFSYLHGNLNYIPANDMASLIEGIKKYTNESSGGCTNPFRIDCALRCILVSLRDGKCYLNKSEIRNVLNDLYPLIEVMEDRKLLNRQSRFFD
jgi:hypothetical protein